MCGRNPYLHYIVLLKRPRLELHASKMAWYMATLNEPECREVDLDLRREVEEVEAVIRPNYQ